MGSQSPISMDPRLETLVYDSDSMSYSPSLSVRLAGLSWRELLEVFSLEELLAATSVGVGMSHVNLQSSAVYANSI